MKTLALLSALLLTVACTPVTVDTTRFVGPELGKVNAREFNAAVYLEPEFEADCEEYRMAECF